MSISFTTPCSSAVGSLILLQDDFDALTGSNVLPILAVDVFSSNTEEYSETNCSGSGGNHVQWVNTLPILALSNLIFI